MNPVGASATIQDTAAKPASAYGQACLAAPETTQPAPEDARGSKNAARRLVRRQEVCAKITGQNRYYHTVSGP